MFYTHRWWYKTASKSLPDAPDMSCEEEMGPAVAIFFHCEEKDQDNEKGVVQKFVKNAKWISGKFETKNIVLHSFNHLGTSKASPIFAKRIFEDVKARLERTGFTVMNTPFGYFNEFKMHVAGDSLAKVYKEF